MKNAKWGKGRFFPLDILIMVIIFVKDEDKK